MISTLQMRHDFHDGTHRNPRTGETQTAYNSFAQRYFIETSDAAQLHNGQVKKIKFCTINSFYLLKNL